MARAKVTILQRKDGTVLRHLGKRWEYLSPLFGEWLRVLRPTNKEILEMQPYPAALNVPDVFDQKFIQQHEVRALPDDKSSEVLDAASLS